MSKIRVTGGSILEFERTTPAPAAVAPPGPSQPAPSLPIVVRDDPLDNVAPATPAPPTAQPQPVVQPVGKPLLPPSRPAPRYAPAQPPPPAKLTEVDLAPTRYLAPARSAPPSASARISERELAKLRELLEAEKAAPKPKKKPKQDYSLVAIVAGVGLAGLLLLGGNGPKSSGPSPAQWQGF